MDRIEFALQPIVDDPEAFHREALASLVEEKGADWVREHTRQLEGNGKAAKLLFGL